MKSNNNNKISMFHNSKCSKSRQTLALLEEKSITPVVVEYLKNPPTFDELKHVVSLLGCRPRDIVRVKEDEFKSLSVDLEDDDAVLTMLADNPKLIERPIVWTDSKAVVGRPPENIDALL